MVTAAKTLSQVGTHMSVAFAITYAATGSVAFGGLAALLEPIINVMLLPLHEKLWSKVPPPAPATMQVLATGAESDFGAGRTAFRVSGRLAAKKLTQLGLHMGVAFGVMYWATGSLAVGGLAAVLEPLCNVILLPFHDDAWEKFRRRLKTRSDRLASDVSAELASA